MVTRIKSGSSKEEIKKALDEITEKPKKGFEASKFCGILKLEQDALKIQKNLRDEWE